MPWSARIVYFWTVVVVIGGVAGVVFAGTVPDAFIVGGLTFALGVFGLVLGAVFTDNQ